MVMTNADLSDDRVDLNVMVKFGIIRILAEQMHSNNDHRLARTAARALGTIGSHSIHLRDQVMQTGALQRVTQLCELRSANARLCREIKVFKHFERMQQLPANLPHTCARLMGTDEALQLEAAIDIKTLLSSSPNLVDDIIGYTGLVKHTVQLIRSSTSTELQVQFFYAQGRRRERERERNDAKEDHSLLTYIVVCVCVCVRIGVSVNAWTS
jgi:hypothetical protein